MHKSADIADLGGEPCTHLPLRGRSAKLILLPALCFKYVTINEAIMGMYHSNCWIWAILQWVSLGGRLRMYRAGAGWVPRMAWSIDGVTWWRFEPDQRVRYATLPRWRQLVPYHVLWYAGHVARDRMV